jgi:hypothetical protein
MDLHPEVKTAIKELPPAERVITMALKQIYEKIKELHLAKRKEIETNHMNFNDRFFQIEQQVPSASSLGIQNHRGEGT